MPFQPCDMIDQRHDFAKRQTDNIMTVRNDLLGAVSGEAQFARRCHAFSLAGRQSPHIDLKVVEMRRVLLDATVHVPQEAGSLTALQCDIARPLPQVGQ